MFLRSNPSYLDYLVISLFPRRTANDCRVSPWVVGHRKPLVLRSLLDISKLEHTLLPLLLVLVRHFLQIWAFLRVKTTGE